MAARGILGWEVGEMGEGCQKGQIFSYKLSHGNITYSVSAIVNNVIAYLKIIKSVGLKSSHVKKFLNWMVMNIN